tara:strand:- start:7186 stop:7485 length:300 start_codon:yes stop_codon:yes gene_type:complete
MNKTLLGLQFDTSKYHKGIQLVLDYKKYELSIVQHEASYGGPQGLFEIMISDGNGHGIELPGITNPGDTVKGWLTLEDVSAICKKLVSITGVEPVKVAI